MFGYEENAHVITEVVKDSKGEITGYKLENGQVLSKMEAVDLAKQGAIRGVTTAVSKLGEEYLRSIPDGEQNNNLSNLPVIEEDKIL